MEGEETRELVLVGEPERLDALREKVGVGKCVPLDRETAVRYFNGLVR